MQQIENASDNAAQQRRPRISSILDGRVSLTEIAATTGVCERTVRNTMDRLDVPYLKFGNCRFYDRDDVRAALLATVVSKAPRGRGRPRKAAQ